MVSKQSLNIRLIFSLKVSRLCSPDQPVR